MKKTDVMELRRRFKKESCTISRMTGCYVDAYKNKVLKFNENFLNLPEEEFYKFLDLAKKTLGGTIGNNILELSFPNEEEEPGGRQQFLCGLRASNLQNEELLDHLYDMIIENYQHIGNFLILVYHDSYDIMSRTSDNLKLDESEEVYEYLLVSVCPVELSKAGLGYLTEENRIGARIRDWVVGAPELGFLFPAFDDHGADIHKIDYFVKDPKDSHAEFVETVLGCGARRTATEQKKTFQAIVKSAYGANEEQGRAVLMDLTESISNRVEEVQAQADAGEILSAPIVLNDEVIKEILEENEVDPACSKIIRDVCKDEFADEQPMLEHLVDSKELEKSIREKREKALVKENIELKQQLAESTPDADMVLKVAPDKEELVRSEVIGDQRYVLIPIGDEDDNQISDIISAIRSRSSIGYFTPFIS